MPLPLLLTNPFISVIRLLVSSKRTDQIADIFATDLQIPTFNQITALQHLDLTEIFYMALIYKVKVLIYNIQYNIVEQNLYIYPI